MQIIADADRFFATIGRDVSDENCGGDDGRQKIGVRERYRAELVNWMTMFMECTDIVDVEYLMHKWRLTVGKAPQVIVDAAWQAHIMKEHHGFECDFLLDGVWGVQR